MIINTLSISKDSQAGMALPMALILLVVASIIIVPGLWAMQSFTKINSNVEQDTVAYYAADAGVADCIWKYKYGTAPTSSYTLTNIDGMNVDVTLLPQSTATNLFWQSSAPSGSASKAQVVIQINKTSGTQGVFTYAAGSLNGNITMSGGATISSDTPSVTKGDAYANGSMTASKKNNGQINGNATATGTVSTNINVDGTRTNGATDNLIIVFPAQADIDAYITQAKTQGNKHTGNLSLSGGTTNLGGTGNDSWITGNLSLGGTADIHVEGTLYIEGTFSMSAGTTMSGGNVIICKGTTGSTTINLSGGSTAQLPLYQNPLLIAQNGNVTIQNTPLSAIVYVPNGSVTLSGTATVYGSVYAKSITIGGSGSIVYEAGLLGTTGLPAWMPSPGGTPIVMGYDYR